MYILAETFNREAPAQKESPASASSTSTWIGVQGFLAGLVLSIVGIIAVAVLSSDENRVARIGWAIGGALTTLALVLLAV
jgi:hypothetical protein